MNFLMKNKINLRSSVLLLTVLVAAWLGFFPLEGQSAEFSQSAAVILLTLVFWSTGVFPPFLTGLLFFGLAVVLDLIDPNVLFAGFGSTAVWLIVSGFVIGSAITNSGMGRRLAAFISPYVTQSYAFLIGGLVLSAVALGFVMPSSVGRAVVLIPIGMALADRVGFIHGSNGRLGIATSLAVACNMPSFAVLPANIPNMILAGASETLYGIEMGYTEYLWLHFPILGILKSVVLVWVVLRIFPDQIATPISSKSDQTGITPAERALQKKTSMLLGITLLFWMTDSWHGINPAWVGLFTAIFLLLPKWGVVQPKDFNKSVDFATVVFVAAALGLGALVNSSGIGTAMGNEFAQLLPSSEDSSFLSYMALSVGAALTGLVATIPGVPTVLTPMAGDFAQITGFSLPVVLMTQVVGFSTIVFPYQVGPLIVAMQLSGEPLRKLLRITIPLAIITVVFLMPLDYLWWRLIGWL